MARAATVAQMRRDHARKTTGKSRAVVSRMMREVHENEPSTVRRANVSEARKEQMRKAIALNKARKAGARIPRQGGY